MAVVESLAQLLRVLLPRQLFCVATRPLGASDEHQPLVPARPLGDSPQGHEQMYFPDVTPQPPFAEWSLPSSQRPPRLSPLDKTPTELTKTPEVSGLN